MGMSVAVQGAVPSFASVDFGRVAKPIAERWAADALREIKSQWPVATGASLKGWGFNVAVTITSVNIIIINQVPYSPHVHKKGDPTLLGQALINQALARVIPLMNAEIQTAYIAACNQATKPAPSLRK